MHDFYSDNYENFVIPKTVYFVGPWVLGEQYSMCDPYLALVTRWLRPDGVLLDNFPKLKAHDVLMRTRSSMQSTLPIYA